MATALQLPPERSPAKRAGRTLFRKLVLPVGKLDVRGRQLDFTPQVLAELKQTFEERAMDQVPFVLANEANEHTDDPDRFRGEVQALEVADDGLYATVETTDRGTALLADNPKLPVSVRAFPPELGRAGGRWVLGHVCGTLDPVAKGMGGWAAVDASEDVQVLDLSGGAFVPSGGGVSDSGVAEQGSSTAEAPGVEQRKLLERFRDFLSGDGGKDAADTGGAAASAADETKGESKDTSKGTGAGESGDQVTDAEIDRVLTALLADADGDGDGENGSDGGDDTGSEEGDSQEGEAAAADREPVAATASKDAAVELANSRLATVEATLSAERAERAKERFADYRRELVEDGVPPSMVELARPVLEHPSAGPVELSNGTRHDVQDTVRKLLDAARGTVELSERGSAVGQDADAEQRRKEWAETAEKEGRVL